MQYQCQPNQPSLQIRTVAILEMKQRLNFGIEANGNSANSIYWQRGAKKPIQHPGLYNLKLQTNSFSYMYNLRIDKLHWE